MKFTLVLCGALVAYWLFILTFVTKDKDGHANEGITLSLPFGKSKLSSRVRNSMEDVRRDLVALEVVNPKDLQQVNQRTDALLDSWKRLQIDWPNGEYSSQRREIERTVYGYVAFVDTFRKGYPDDAVVTTFAMAMPENSKRNQVMDLYKRLAGGGSDAQSAFAKAVISSTSIPSARNALDEILDGRAK